MWPAGNKRRVTVVVTPERHTRRVEEMAVPDDANTQLRLLQTHRTRREWTLDARTRSLGRRGVAEAREILRRHQPPQPVDAYSKAS
jgi:hypothetical protein